MEHLSKQQIVLLAVLISFVTSLATGIVTVSLMDQSPEGFSRTITQVIQKTVATVPTGATSTAAVANAAGDQVADATENVIPSLVRLRDGDKGNFVGIGLIVSKSGAIMADKSLIDTLRAPQAIFADGTSTLVAVVRFQQDGDISFLVPSNSLLAAPKPIAIGTRSRLGQSVWTLSGTSTYELAQGIITGLGESSGSQTPVIRTSILARVLPGSPLFDATGAVIGISTNSVSKDQTQSFYPVAAARDGIPK